MFDFSKKVDEEQELNPVEDGQEKDLAEILGAQDNDTNITAGVDAILDEDAEISNEQDNINSFDVNLQEIDNDEPVDLDEGIEYATREKTVDNEVIAEDSSDVIGNENELEDISNDSEEISEDKDVFIEESDREQNNDLSLDDILGDDDDNYSVDDILANENVKEDDALNLFTEVEEKSEDSLSESISEVKDDEIEKNVENDFIPSAYEKTEDIETVETEPNIVVDNIENDNEIAVDESLVEDNSGYKAENIFNQGNEVIEEEQTWGKIADGLWHLEDIVPLNEKIKVVNADTGLLVWGADKYQQELRIDAASKAELNDWSVFIFNEFEVQLSKDSTEVVVEKDDKTIRYADLLCKGAKKLTIFNQSIYKFVRPQEDFFTVQGNVICGMVDDSFSLAIKDYINVSLLDKFNRCIRFESPRSGIICGPKGVKIFFANAQAITVAVLAFKPEPEVFEYIPSVKDFDDRTCFVYSEEKEETEFVANDRKKNLVINVGASLYGWNVRFDNGNFMSLRDVLLYQDKYKQPPSPNGELFHGSNVLKFFGVETFKVREKTIYFSYGRV